MSVNLPLHSARLELRRFRKDDAEQFHQVFGDPVVMQYVDGVRDFAATQQMIDNYVRQQESAGFSFWALVERCSGTLIGDAGLYPLAGEGPEIELGYTLGQRWWGKGYATEAGRICLQVAFNDLGLERVVAVAHPDNHHSHNVLRKLGFVCVGERILDGSLHRAFQITRPQRGIGEL